MRHVNDIRLKFVFINFRRIEIYKNSNSNSIIRTRVFAKTT